ncbi:MAG TPA: ribosome small subunit-dependent GTPase A [Symbiobacteriaceae bacterium]|nr:ribosome small subunit-dependent GTPase A [Symbiobacteriaceae bacterium]
MPQGHVIRSHSNIYYVLVDGEIIECRPRGRFRLDRTGVLAGDRVEVHIEQRSGDKKEGRIEAVLERATVLQRPPVANVEQALIVFTLAQPEADFPFLDRVLIHVEQAGVKPVILLNKIDLVEPERVARFVKEYQEQVGYPVHTLSAVAGTGMAQIPELLHDKVSVLAGHSGVGKSRLVRALLPDRQDIRVGDLSEKLGRGKHTTRHVELIPLPAGGLIVDAPGFTYLEFAGMEKWDLRDFFPEFRSRQHDCRFDDCLHAKEPDCAVQAAVAAGEIPASRYQNYRHFLTEVEALKRW